MIVGDSFGLRRFTLGGREWTDRVAAGGGAIGSSGGCAAFADAGGVPGQRQCWLPKKPTKAKETTATDATAQTTRERRMEGVAAGLSAVRIFCTRRRACKNSSADGKRCAGSFSRARRMASASPLARRVPA